MEVYVNAKSLRFSQAFLFPNGSAVKHLLERVGVCCQDFYVVTGGRRSDSDELLQDGCVYHVEPRLRGGKGGFGSMLRALGAQIEKTTNREACRDLSGRRLRDVNHEKEMADWLKKQADREAEKEQRRAERLQRKLSEPKHMFADPQYQQQCHDLSERLEESVLKGAAFLHRLLLLASCDGSLTSPVPLSGLQASSDEEEEEDEEEEASSSSSSSCGGVVAMTTQRREEPESSSR
uniref:SDE2 telomere maintenance homolog (S. pombe) n=1 Tax=Salarias fasciatus TaxID=181472 RepID=A0A672GKR5_SALFA